MALEKSLRVLQLQANSELCEAATRFSRSAARHADAAHELNEVQAINGASRDEMRRLGAASSINPAAYELVRRMLQGSNEQVARARNSLNQAAGELDTARVALGHHRQRESDLLRAIDAEKRKARLEQQTKEGVVADDMWLQARRGRP